MVHSPERDTSEPQLWPIFICYRQVDGLPAARRLHELLDKRDVSGPKGEPIRFDAYLDQTMPAVADWREIHRPYLEKARALIVVCTPGAKIDEGPDDWVHKEINWWLANRNTVPILIDPLRQGVRYVPAAIYRRWPEIQRIPLVEAEWSNLPAVALKEKEIALRRQIVGNILPSGAAIYAAELEAERARAEGLRVALQVSQASLYDAQAASCFDEARREDARYEAARQAQLEKRRELNELAKGKSALAPGASLLNREQNLRYESKQLDESMKELSATAAASRRQGYAQLKLADDAWKALQLEGQAQAEASRRSPTPPYIFSIELINAGAGESILVHYGAPDDTHLLMINAGPGRGYQESVRRRLQGLKTERFGGAPTPIELLIVSDQDEDKSGGLGKLLEEQAEAGEPADRVVEIRRIWANMFASFGLRGQIRGAIEKLGIPKNVPFDHHVARPDRGLLVFDGSTGWLGDCCPRPSIAESEDPLRDVSRRGRETTIISNEAACVADQDLS